jgi:DNA-binding IclR family transcriptional regulator
VDKRLSWLEFVYRGTQPTPRIRHSPGRPEAGAAVTARVELTQAGYGCRAVLACNVRHGLRTSAAKTILAELGAHTGETAVLSVYDRQRAARMFVAASPSQHAVRFVPALFAWLPMHAGATALAILAYRPEDERRSIYAKGLLALTGTTLTEPDELESALAEVRGKGFAVSHDETDVGASALAAPVFSTVGVMSSIGVVAPRQRFDEALERALESRVVEAAARLGRRLGDPGSSLQTVS